MHLKLRLQICFVILLILNSINGFAVEQISGNWDGLRKMMSSEEFKASGLDKLSPEQLHKLDRWFLRFLAYDSAQLVKADKKIQKLQQKGVRRRIVGHLSGWTGKTVFRLDNGEIWQQRLASRYAISLDNPEVEIKKNLFGFYELKIIKTGRRVGVSRLK